MVIHSYRFSMLFYIEHVHLQSVSVILHFSPYFKNTGKKHKKIHEKTCKITDFFYSVL